MGFIKLTKLDGSPVYVNIAHIQAIGTYYDKTCIDIDGWEQFLEVKESTDAVMAIIELKERGKGV